MSTVVLLLRGVSLLAFGGPMLAGVRGRRLDSADEVDETVGSRLPVVANIGAFGLFFAVLFTTSGGLEGTGTVLFGLAGASLAVAAAVVPTFIWRARVEERLLVRLFGECYQLCQSRTKMLLPYLL